MPKKDKREKERVMEEVGFDVPDGFSIHSSDEISMFDIDNIESDDVETFLIRMPHELLPADLDTIKVNLKPDNPAHPLGRMRKAGSRFQIYEFTDQSASSNINAMGGLEMDGLRCLFPSSKRHGALSMTQKPFDHRLIINQVVDIPDSTSQAQEILDKPITKRTHPEGLKMRFHPYGFDTKGPHANGIPTTPTIPSKRTFEEADIDQSILSSPSKAKKEKKEKKDKKVEKKEKKEKKDKKKSKVESM
ncbi:hypothetical protein BZG36_00199 [Bifiguratus adelaidae]|uniref:Uncharacterized protein n=1 Tax=Bifiguratus adelaidae TaxID=1938954 RepID=A0A261Y8M1_9FUNG|nr:hypothetical protein BZG36_00199 [Bifiguratus adelaidae]